MKNKFLAIDIQFNGLALNSGAAVKKAETYLDLKKEIEKKSPYLGNCFMIVFENDSDGSNPHYIPFGFLKIDDKNHIVKEITVS